MSSNCIYIGVRRFQSIKDFIVVHQILQPYSIPYPAFQRNHKTSSCNLCSTVLTYTKPALHNRQQGGKPSHRTKSTIYLLALLWEVFRSAVLRVALRSKPLCCPRAENSMLSDESCSVHCTTACYSRDVVLSYLNRCICWYFMLIWKNARKLDALIVNINLKISWNEVISTGYTRWKCMKNRWKDTLPYITGRVQRACAACDPV